MDRLGLRGEATLGPVQDEGRLDRQGSAAALHCGQEEPDGRSLRPRMDESEAQRPKAVFRNRWPKLAAAAALGQL